MEHKTKHRLLIPPVLLRLDHLLETVVFPVTGITLFFLGSHITAVVGYLVGGAMVLFGALMMGHALYRKEYRSRETHNTAVALCLLICGAVVLVRRDDCLSMLGTIWGILGIYFGVEDLTELFYRISHRERFLFLAIETAADLVLSVLLLLHPADHFATHMHLLGIQLIVTSLRSEHFRRIPSA